MSADGVTLRPAADGDLDTLRALFADAVRTAGPSAYDAEQIEAWAAAADDARRFRRRLLGEWAVVADAGGQILGFGSLDGDRVSAIYVRGDAQRCGLGRRLLAAVVDEARRRGRARLCAEASAFSLGLFLADGFYATEAERIVRGGVAFDRHLVARDLGAAR